MRIMKPLALVLGLLLLACALSGCMVRLIYDAVQGNGNTPAAETPAATDSRQNSVQLPAAPETPAQDVPVKNTSALPGMEDGFLPLTSNSPVSLDLDGDGTEDSLTVSISTDGEYGTETILLIANYGDAVKTTQVKEAYFQSAYLSVDSAGNIGVVVSFDYASDDYQTCIYLFDSREAVLTDETSGFVESVEGGILRLRSSVDVLGTWSAYKEWTLNAGVLTAVGDGLWYIEADADRALTAIGNVNVTLEEGDGTTEALLMPGTRILPIATDAEGLLFFQTVDDCRIGIIAFTYGDYGMTLINDVQDDGWFENIQYSG